MNILVTGGAGFIGSHLVDALIDQGHDVIVLDNLSTGLASNISDEAEFIEGDITSVDLQTLPKVDAIYHLAAQVKASASLNDPTFDANTNILGTITMLELAKMHKVNHFVSFSSAAVYGDARDLPTKESATIQPMNPYGVSKYAAEEYVRMYHQQYAIPYTIFRPSNVYGPRQNTSAESGVIAIFCRLAKEGSPLTIFGDGEQTRDFIYVQDVVAGCLSVLDKPLNAVANISTNEQISINGLVKALAQASEKDILPTYQPARPGDPLKSCLDNSKLCSTGWSAKTTLSQGLVEVMKP